MIRQVPRQDFGRPPWFPVLVAPVEFSKRRRLPNSLALAALAVILEHRATDFAEEFLHDLSRLRLSELSAAIYVARECLKNR